MKHIEKYIGIGILLFAVGFNLWTYRAEVSAHTDPNDNTFQYALIDRTSQIWTFAQQKCTGVSKVFCVISYLSDHWVPNWAQGYNLPSYYSHIPQIVIVTTWKMISLFFPLYDLFTHYHYVIYALLCLFPIALFIALLSIGLSFPSASIGALIASHLSTDGLYGLDSASFLWRGYGLSSQLFAMIWLPIAIAFAWKYLRGEPTKRSLILAILSLAAVTSGHLGVGIIACMSIGVLAFGKFIASILSSTWEIHPKRLIHSSAKRLLYLFGGIGILLGYWIIPILRDGNYHNISVWDGIWKFDSFGYRTVLAWFFDGALFDFGRLPVLTMLTIVGLFVAARTVFFDFALLFVFWILMYFGRTTWGPIFTLIPGMSEFHLSRFIVGVHVSGLFLIPLCFEWIVAHVRAIETNKKTPLLWITMVIVAVLLIGSVYPQTIRYAAHNDFLIARGNTNYANDADDIDNLIQTIKTNIQQKPGRVFAGRGGSWGKNFRIAETPMYMHLSTYGIPVVLWLPETWSPNSDTEQYFSENNPGHYNLYNVRFVATPSDLASEHIQPFWKLLASGKTWKLYEVTTNGYIATGVRPAIVSSSKTDYRSVVRLWMHSQAHGQALFPELTYDTAYPKKTGLPNFRMLDEVTYTVPDGSVHNLFSENPLYVSPLNNPSTIDKLTITSQTSDSDMVFAATVDVPSNCLECIVILKQSFHPSWRATIDGKQVRPFAVFPFFTAVKVESAGTHNIVFSYESSWYKKLLLFIGVFSLGILLWLVRSNHIGELNSKRIRAKKKP